MKRFTHLTLALSTVALLTLLLILTMGAQPAVQATGDTIKVPDDHPTIQGAIDAATDGDTILVAIGIYTENLSIMEGITLSGGWSDDFSTRSPADSIINANRMGRAISITCPTSDTVVTVDGFSIFDGDASGLGMPEMPEIPETPSSKDLPYGTQIPSAVSTSNSRSPAEQADQLRAGLADLVARGLYPGGEPAHQAMLARLERVTAVAEEAQARADAPSVEPQGQSQQGAGSGGGVYSYNASLVLQNNSIQDSVASQDGDGLGGGVFAAKAPPGGVRIVSNFFRLNVATIKGTGMGGGLYVSDAPGATINNNELLANVASNEGKGHGGGVYVADAPQGSIDSNTLWQNVATGNGAGLGGGIYVMQAPDAVIGNNDIQDNIASSHGDGQGGGIYVIQSSNAYIQDNTLTRNLGSNAGPGNIGFGGGLAVESSADVLVRNNQVEGNFGSANWHAGSGAGGGFYLHHVDGVVVRDNSLNENVGTLKGNGGAGGLYLGISQNALVEDNVVTGNWGGLFQFHVGDISQAVASGAGGIGVVNAHSAIVRGNEISENIALAYGVELANGTGGGIDGRGLFDNTQLIDNVITGNVACQMGCSWGGFGGGVYLASLRDVVVVGNTFADNSGTLLDEFGNGGGLWMFDAVDSQVLRNRFLRNRGGMDGGIGGGLMIGRGPYITEQSVTVDANLFLDNLGSPDPSALSAGGAASIAGISVEGGFSFTNNVLVGNRATSGGGLELDSVNEGTLTNNTLYDNGETGVLVTSDVPGLTLTNNIIVSHTVGISVTEGTTATISYTLWNDNDTDIGGGGTISHTHPVYGDPAFVDPSNNDYHLAIGSPAIDAGDPAGVPPAPDHDLDGVTRPKGLTVDIGAYEWFSYYQYLPLVTKTYYQRTGWAIGQDENNAAAIVHTADGGLTWQRQGDPTAWTDLYGNDISAVDNQTAWAALSSGPGEPDGIILHTTNGGGTWVTQTIPSGLTGGIKGIKGLSRDEAWAASQYGMVLHTTDSGATWNVVPHPTVPIIDVNRIDAMGSDVWIADDSDSGAVVHTTDGGLTWQAEYLPCEDSPLTVHAFSPQAVWASGSILPDNNPSFYRSVGGYGSWDFIKRVGANDHLDDICAASPDDVWGALNGEESRGRIWKVHVEDDGTPGGLAIAKEVTPPELEGLNAEGITCLDKRVAWVAAQNERHFPELPLGVIVHTRDGGETWTQQSAPTDIEYWKISFVGARR